MSKFLYLKKAKTDDTESESESEDDIRDEGSYQLFAENEEDSMDQGGEDTRDPDPNNDSDGKNEEMVEDLPIPAVLSFFDVGFLKFDQTTQRPIMSQRLRTEIIARGSDLFQNRNGPFVANSGGRSMNSTWFKRRLANGDEVGRSWLLYSPVNKEAYCFCCLLFPTSSSNSQSPFESAGEFTNWRHIERLKDHENSPCHRKSFTKWKEAERRIIYGKRIDSELEAQIESEKQHWRNILNRILSCIKVLASQNMALCGHREKLSTADEGANIGNFLALLKFLAEYDLLTANHLQHAKENPGSVSYLSPDIQNEFINLLACTVRDKLLTSIKRSKYFSILLDSTPDLGHREQLSKVIKFVDIDFVTKNVEIRVISWIY